MIRGTVTALPGTETILTESSRRGVGFYRNAIYRFALLLIILPAMRRRRM